jgi:quercetin dioxygenase-like cupin family protein
MAATNEQILAMPIAPRTMRVVCSVLVRRCLGRSMLGRERRLVIVEHHEQSWHENRPGSHIQLIADSTAGVSGLAVVNQVCQPGVGAPSHVHDFEEILTVVEGSAEIWVCGERRVVGPGSSAFVPTGAVHGFRNVGTGLLRLEAVIASTQLHATFVDDPDG